MYNAGPEWTCFELVQARMPFGLQLVCIRMLGAILIPECELSVGSLERCATSRCFCGVPSLCLHSCLYAFASMPLLAHVSVFDVHLSLVTQYALTEKYTDVSMT